MNTRTLGAFAIFAFVWAAQAETHTVTFRKMDGTVLSRVEVEHGGSVTAPTAPTVANYTFKTWDHGDWLGCVTNNVTCWALYEWTDKSKMPDTKTDIDSSNVATREQPYTLDEYFQMYSNIAWTDEFSGTKLKDGFYTARSHTDGELCNKLDANRIVEDGLLKLRVKREDSGGYHFTSGEISTGAKNWLSSPTVTFKKGRIEIRAKLNAVRGQWPSFWTMHTGWTSDYNEIDVFEQLSGSDWIGGTLHAGHGGIPRTSTSSRGVPEDGFTFSEGFHRIGAIVTEKELIWYVDDHIFKRLDLSNEPWSWTPNVAKYILLCSGLCAGGWLENLGPELKCATEADVPADFQQEDYEIDYLRVYTNTQSGNTQSYDAAPSTAKLSGPVRASMWPGSDLSDNLGSTLYSSGGEGWVCVNNYVRKAIAQYFEREKADVVVFLKVPPDSDQEKKGSSDIPGISAAFIDNPIMVNRTDGVAEANPERRAGVFFNHERFAPGEAVLGELDLGMGSTFTNVYAICADLKEKATGARVKVVGVNVVATNGIENTSSNVSQAFNTLFSKLNSMKQNGDNVIVVFGSPNWSCYYYSKTLANNGIGDNYEWLGQNDKWPAYQHVYVSKNRQSASMTIPGNLTVPKKNLTSSYSHKTSTALATVVFDELPDDPGDGFADEFAASDYAKAMNVTVTGYSGTALANFPVLVKLSTAISGFSYSDFRLPNGGDLRFTDASGNVIPHEIDTWNPNGVSTVWVKVPSLEANARIIAFYGCDTPARPLAEKVWDSDYVGVWHLGESGLPLKESSGNSFDFTYQTGTGVGYAAGGIVGNSVNFPANGLTNTLVSLDHDNLDGFTKFTLEAWTKQAAHKDVGGILSKRETSARESAYYFYDKAGKTMLKASTNGTSAVECINTIQPPLNQWNHQVYSFDTTTSSSNIKGYLNGASAGSVSKAFRKIFAGRGNLHLGNLCPDLADNTFNGQIDEVRISRCVRSAAWIKATHDTVTDANFLTYAMATAPYSSSYGQLDMSAFAKKVDVTFTGYSGTTLANFPVLVRLSTAISGFSYSDFCIPNGGDLRFADATGKLLPHEIDTWNPSGETTVWVKVPSLTANAKITACYGCSAPPLVAAKDVWDENYVGVWHLGEAALPLVESSKTSTDFTTSKGSGIGYAASGIVGGSVDFGASGNSRALLANDHAALDGFTKCTFEAWTYIDASLRSYKGGAQTNDLNKGLLAKRNGYSSECSYYLFDTGSATQFYVCQDGTSPASASSKVAAPSGAWTHQVYTFDGTSSSSNVEGWKNGVSAGKTTQAKTSIYAGSANLCLGNFQSGDARNFPGKIDEVRISKTVRSGDWLKATHDTIANANFATYAAGSDTPPPDPERILYVNVAAGATNTLDSALVTSYITNIVKQGAGTLRTVALPNYQGDFRVEGGVLDVGVKNGAGKHGYANTIYVGNGGSLGFSGQVSNILDNKKLVFEGAGAAAAPLSGKFFNTGTWVVVGGGMSIQLKSDTKFVVACWNRIMIRNADIDMGGHDLSFSCSPGNQVEFGGSTFRNPGNIIANQGMAFVTGTSLTTFEAKGSPEIRLKDNAMFWGNGPVSASAWTIVATNSNPRIGGYANKFPNDSNSGWDGKIVLGKSTTSLAYYTGGSGSTVLSNTVFNVKGRMSGTAAIKVGPGWLNLHTSAADNTCSGAVTVTGRTPSTSTPDYPVLAGGGGIGLWNGAVCFPNASSITFTNTARLAFMDSTACSVPKVKFIALEGETMSISGGVHTARSTMAGITKTGAGTLVIDSPVSVTGLVDVTAGTLTVANRSSYITDPTSQEAVLAVLPQFASLKFASGTTFDLSENPGQMINDLEGSPVVTNAGLVGVAGKWTLDNPSDQLVVVNANATPDGGVGVLCFATGATFDLADEAAFRTAVQAAGPNGLMVAHAYWILNPEVEGQLEGMQGMITLPQPASTLGPGWSMVIGRGPGDDFDGRGLYLRYSDPSASGYAAWIAGKGLSGSAAAFERETNGIKNGIRYAFDIDPSVATVGDPIIQVVRDANGNPSVEARNLASGRTDVTFGILATENLGDWSNANLVPMEKFTTDGLWKPAASGSSGYVFPDKLFFKYSIEMK